jgi:DNA repair exonuclease SbcCD ATPase subunit
MADQGDTPLGKPSPPGIIVTPAEESTTNEVTKSSEDFLQASHDTEDDGALPKVHSGPEADTNPESEEKPLVSPEDDEFEISGERRPVSPVNDDEDEESVTSSHFSDSDSDEDTRGRARRSSRDRDMSPPITFTTRVADQNSIDKATAERRRSQEGTKGIRRAATKSKSPLAIKSITRDGDKVIVTSPTHGTITITNPKVAEELDKSLADGQFTLSPIKTALSLSQDFQDAIEQAFQEKEILRLAQTYKNGPKHTPPPVPERPGSPQFGLSSAAAEAQYEDNNPASQQTILPGMRAAAETGSLGHRRSVSVEIARQSLQQNRYNLIHNDLRRLAVNPHHNVDEWNKDALWGFMRTQDNRVLSIAEVLHKNNLESDVEGMITLQDERRYARSEVERIKSEYDRKMIANEQRYLELKAELADSEAENERLRAAQTLDSTREAILNSPTDKLSPEAKDGLETIDKLFVKLNSMQETASKGMEHLHSHLDTAQELHDKALQQENQELRKELGQMKNQIVWFAEQDKKTELKIREQKQTIEKLNKAYTALDKENTQLKARIQDEKNVRDKTEMENAELKVQLENCLNARSQSAKDESNLKPAEEASPAIKNEGSTFDSAVSLPWAARDSNIELSGKVTALENLLAHARGDCDKYRELYIAANEQRVWSFAHYATVKDPWPVPTRELITQLIVTVVNDNRRPIEETAEPADVALNGRSGRDLQFELTGLIEDLPLSGTLTRNQVAQWLGAGIGIREIFEEIRSLDLYLDKEIETEILRVLIEQGWCYGNFDVFAGFVFSDRLISREEFIVRVNDIMAVLDRLDKGLVKTETDLELALNRVGELEQWGREQSVTITAQAHELNKAETALDAIEEDRISPGGTLEKLIELQGEHEDLKARSAKLSDEVAYYEEELILARQEADSNGFTSDDPESCTVLAHRDLEAKIRDLEKRYELDSLKCPHCNGMEIKIKDLNRKLREAKRDAITSSSPGSPSSSSADATEQSPPYCDDCMYLTMQLREAKQKSRDFEDKLRLKKNQIRSCHYEIDKTKDDLVEAQKEFERLRSEGSSSSPKSASTAPSSIGSSPAKSSETDEVKKLRDLYAASQQSLAGEIAQRLGEWGATKLAAPPAGSEQELFDSFDTESNARRLASDKAKLEKQNAILQKNLDDFEATSQQENSNDLVTTARIENLRRQVDQIPDLQVQISTLTKEKEDLIKLKDYLSGEDKPECCGAVKEELHKEIEAHAATKKELDDAINVAASEEEDDPCEDVKQELQKTKDELSQTKSRMSREYNDLVVEFNFNSWRMQGETSRSRTLSFVPTRILAR